MALIRLSDNICPSSCRVGLSSYNRTTLRMRDAKSCPKGALSLAIFVAFGSCRATANSSSPGSTPGVHRSGVASCEDCKSARFEAGCAAIQRATAGNAFLAAACSASSFEASAPDIYPKLVLVLRTRCADLQSEWYPRRPPSASRRLNLWVPPPRYQEIESSVVFEYHRE